MVEAALEGLDGVKAVEVHLVRDLFRVDYDAEVVAVAAMLQAIAEAGFEGRTVEAPEGGAVAGITVNPAGLPGPVREAFERAREHGRLVLVDVHGPG
jgi:copper chaperone CopZ